jgi:hypothetical protein
MKKFMYALSAIMIGGIFGAITIAEFRNAIVLAHDAGDDALAAIVYAGAWVLALALAALVGGVCVTALDERSER